MAVNIIGQFLTQLQANQGFAPMSLPTTAESNFSGPSSSFQTGAPGPSSFRKRRATATVDSYDSTSTHDRDVIATLSSMRAAHFEPQPTSVPNPGPSNRGLVDDDVLLEQLQHACQDCPEAGDANLVSHLPIGGSDAPVNIKSTYLGGIPVNCILDGGEQWVAVPQVIARALYQHDHNFVTSKLRAMGIVETGATPEQMLAMKRRKVIQPTAVSCNLITKPCAELLVAAVHDPLTFCAMQTMKYDPILIQHQSFGGAEGRLYSVLYPNPCIQCVTCTHCMSPLAFVRHSHNTSIPPALNWGAETTNWKDYIALHETAERDDYQIAQFDIFIRRVSDESQEEAVSPDQLIAKKASVLPLGALPVPPMFPANQFGAIAAQLLAQHQSQQQNHAPPMSENSIPNIAAALASMPQVSQPSNIMALAQQLQQQNLLAALVQQQQQHPQNVNGINVLNVLNHLRNQAALANAGAAGPSVPQQQQHAPLEDGETPRKRANTVSDPTMRLLTQPQPQQQQRGNEFPLTGISFGALPEDRELLTMLQQLTTVENVAFITDRINAAIVRRMQPIVADNAHLRGQLEETRAELQAKNDMIARLSATAQRAAPEAIEVDEDDDNIVVDDVVPAVSSR
uniref:C-SKI_SMAD_bind domain-containing protein n=1 Tax=Panagrellus redivivus TaxID=6233 RepID=A0A7E4ZZR4_PANRE